MLEKREVRISNFLLKGYTKRLHSYVSGNTKLDADEVCGEYKKRFYKYMDEVDMGEGRGRFTSYLNIFSGLCVYEILREQGLSEQDAVSAYDAMCVSLRKFSSVLYRGADLLPNGYSIVVNSLKNDLSGEKAVCWDTKVLKDDDDGFTYEISRCLCYDTCKEHGYPEFCKVFCTHDWYAYGVLKRHAAFVRKSTIAENGTVCNDTILKIDRKSTK